MNDDPTRRDVLRSALWAGGALLAAYPARALDALDIDFGTVRRWGTGTPHDIGVVMPPDAFPIASDFGARHGPTGRLRAGYGGTGLPPVHRGIDILAPRGTPVIAAADGTVIWSGPADCPGEVVTLEHGHDFKTWYSHLDVRFVAKGETITRGQVIGLVGLTGTCTAPGAPHLHFELAYYDAQDAINPHKYWHGGPGMVTLFRPGGRYPGRLLTYPVPGKRDLALFRL